MDGDGAACLVYVAADGCNTSQACGSQRTHTVPIGLGIDAEAVAFGNMDTLRGSEGLAVHENQVDSAVDFQADLLVQGHILAHHIPAVGVIAAGKGCGGAGDGFADDRSIDHFHCHKLRIVSHVLDVRRAAGTGAFGIHGTLATIVDECMLYRPGYAAFVAEGGVVILVYIGVGQVFTAVPIHGDIAGEGEFIFFPRHVHKLFLAVLGSVISAGFPQNVREGRIVFTARDRDAIGEAASIQFDASHVALESKPARLEFAAMYFDGSLVVFRVVV